MKVAVFSAHEFEKNYLIEAAKNYNHDLVFINDHLNANTVSKAKDFPCVCTFVTDILDSKNLKLLADGGTRLLTLRSAGYDHVDLKMCEKLGIRVTRVPKYSPNAIAEHAVALILSLNRKIPRSYNRVKDSNFSIDGLVGFDLNKKTVGIIGTGKIGTIMARIMNGFGCNVLAYDLNYDQSLISLGTQYVSLEKLLEASDIISLHLPLTVKTHHILNDEMLSKTKPGVMLINTGRGALIDTQALINHLKSGQVGYAGLDVYENELGIFFDDHSRNIIKDDMLLKLMSFPNVIITSHHAFLTDEALQNIASTTLLNIDEFSSGGKLSNEIVF
jgi:D-lactate dehydrogenase